MNAKRAQQTLEFLVELVGNKADADVGLNAALSEVEDWPGFKVAFGDAEGAFHYPQPVILLYDIGCRQVGVGNVAFQSVPPRVGFDFGFVDAHDYVVLYREELFVAALVDVLFADAPRCIDLAKALYASLSVVPVLGGSFIGVADDDALIAVYCRLVLLSAVFLEIQDPALHRSRLFLYAPAEYKL